jgi:GntR family transcriptional regulator, arabinose operon transcriptional repressor
MTTNQAAMTLGPALGEQSQLKHERVRDMLLGEIVRGGFRPGTLMPTEFRLAELLKVSRSTIRQSLGALEKEGLVRRVRGKGTYVTERTLGGQATTAKAYAIVLPDTRSGYFPSLQYGYGEECRRHHHQMNVWDTDQDVSRQADVILALIDKRVEGMAIVPPTTGVTPPHHIRPLQHQGIPVVFCHRRVAGVKAPLVTFSGLEVGRVAGKAMGQRGHRTVAYFGASSDAELADQYAIGLRAAIQGFGGDLAQRHVHFGSHTHGMPSAEHERMAEEHLNQIMGHPDSPTAILVSFDPTAESLYLQLMRLGYRVPEDVSLVSFGGKWREGGLARELTAVTVDEAELGGRAARLVHEMRQGTRPIESEEEVRLPLSLSDGKTLRTLSEASATSDSW